MAKIYHVDLSTEEREQLELILKKRLSTCEASKRASILLAADRSGEKKWDDKKISETYLVCIRTVERLRERFVTEGLAVSMAGKPRPNLDKIKFDGEVESRLIAIRCGKPESGRSDWTLRLLADKMVQLGYVEDMSIETVRQILKKQNQALAGKRMGDPQGGR